jgi:serine phosphatase RsbU (regulator of sigma subunit)
MQEANAEVSRDNAEMLFVTAFAAILDLRSGELSYCNAGHDNPYLLRRGDASPLRIEDGDGPPLCAMAQFPYRSACRRLAPGDWLFVMTDGVTDARNLAGEVYGPARLERLLVEQVGAEPQASSLVAALKADLAAFVEGAEPFDDITILALRWRGPAGEAPSEAMAAAPAGLVPAAQAPALSPASSSPVPILGARLSGPQA